MEINCWGNWIHILTGYICLSIYDNNKCILFFYFFFGGGGAVLNEQWFKQLIPIHNGMNTLTTY